MGRKNKAVAAGVLGGSLLLAAVFYLRSVNIPVLEPKGQVGVRELHLIIIASLLSLVVVVPVFAMLFTFAYKYREGNHKAKYRPDFDHSRKLETAWWAIPSAIILILSIVTWNSSHALDPYKPLSSKVPQMTIQVVALDWKWLFIYPTQNIATVNFVQIPVNTPVDFVITADAPMNSFWIPQLGGQIYAMPGMSTQLHLIANQNGSFEGRSANISGSGFAGMHFIAKASSDADFQSWMQSVKQNSSSLSLDAYNKLATPSQNNPATYFSSAAPSLYSDIVNKYMAPNTPGMGM